jgi:myo-inositol-1(or 4)-monophosphatase
VDPIDGTTNYAHGHPFWCVSIGLVAAEGPALGVVVAPALQLEWVADGTRSTRNGEGCRVSEQSELSQSLLATGFPYDRQTSSENNFAAFVHFKKITQGIRRCGSAAIDLCFVADGTYDGYWERKLKPWDMAAGIAMVRASGGRATAFDGGPLDVVSGYAIASNGKIHDAIVAELARPGL